MIQQLLLVIFASANLSRAFAVPSCEGGGEKCASTGGLATLQRKHISTANQPVQLDVESGSEGPQVDAAQEPPADAEKERELFELLDKLQPDSGMSKDSIQDVVDTLAPFVIDLPKDLKARTLAAFDEFARYAEESSTVQKEFEVLQTEIQEEIAHEEDQRKEYGIPALFQINYSSADVSAEHQGLFELHSGLKEIIQKYNVDTSAARTLPKEKQKELGLRFVVDALSPSLAQVLRDSRGNWEEPTLFGKVESGPLKGLDKKRLALKCVHGIAAAAPPTFCWKPLGTHTVAPWTCPSDYPTHWGAECFKKCDDGYYWVDGGTCWATCEKGYTDHGATCYWSGLYFYAKHHYWAARKHKDCDYGWEKKGLLCYRPCSYFGEIEEGLTSCGDLSCAATSTSCTMTILSMIGEIAWSITSIAMLVGTSGGAAPAVEAGKQLLKAVGAQGMRMLAKNAAKAMYRAGMQKSTNAMTRNAGNKFTKQDLREGLQESAEELAEQARLQKEKLLAEEVAEEVAEGAVPSLKEHILKDSAEEAAEEAADQARLQNFAKEMKQGTMDNIRENAAKQFCQQLFRTTYTSIDPDYEAFDYTLLDPTGLADMIANCNTSPATCVSKSTNFLNTFDPTGLMGVASAFIQDSCQERSASCDWQSYLSRYPDLQLAFGATNVKSALKHFEETGKTEGRDCTAICDWQSYLDRNTDLQLAFGATNIEQAKTHYTLNGRSEGRDCTHTCDRLRVLYGDRFIQIGDWRFGDFDGIHASVAHKDGKTAQIYRSDGTLHPGAVGTAFSSWSRPTNPDAEIGFGDRFIQLGAWRFGDIDGTHASIAHKDGKTGQIFRSDGTLHPGAVGTAFSSWSRQLGVPSGITFGDRFIQIGDWRFGDIDGTHASIAHKDGKTAQIYRSDGTLHPGAVGTAFSSWSRPTYDTSCFAGYF